MLWWFIYVLQYTIFYIIYRYFFFLVFFFFFKCGSLPNWHLKIKYTKYSCIESMFLLVYIFFITLNILVLCFYYIIDLVVGDANAVVVAWRLLEYLLLKYEVDKQSTLHKAVAGKLMSLNVFLPHWLEASYKVWINFKTILCNKSIVFLWVITKNQVIYKSVRDLEN